MSETNGATAKLLIALRSIMILPIWLYQKLLSPVIPSRCIYTPTCSQYSRKAILKHGLRGFLLGGARVLRCVGGLYAGGDDPVPDRFTFGYLFGSYRKFWREKNN
ncbi:MAG: membrane protein insertion efficiency factor YidD [Spirochaetia bacterium]